MIKYTRPAVAVLAALAASACSSSAGNGSAQSPGPGQVVTPPASTKAAAPTTLPRTSSAPAKRVGVCPKNPPVNGKLNDQGEQIGKIGKSSFTYKAENGNGAGLCVAILTAKRVRFSAEASGAEATGGKGVVFTIQVVNNATAAEDLSGFTVNVKVGAAGTEADQVIDFPTYQDGFTGSVAGGHRATAPYAFAVPPAPQSVVVEISPSFDSDPALFEGTV